MSANKTAKKIVGIVRPCGTEIPQSGCCDGCQVGKKKKGKGGEKEAKGWRKGDKMVMIIKLATDESWLASKTTNTFVFCVSCAGQDTSSLFLFNPNAKG